MFLKPLITLVAENFVAKTRDDISLRETAIKILNVLEYDFYCIMPVSPFDNLIEDLSNSNQDFVLNKLNNFVTDVILSTQTKTKEFKALQLWHRNLGKYFK